VEEGSLLRCIWDHVLSLGWKVKWKPGCRNVSTLAIKPPEKRKARFQEELKSGFIHNRMVAVRLAYQLSIYRESILIATVPY
jgi:hypothetical protein